MEQLSNLEMDIEEQEERKNKLEDKLKTVTKLEVPALVQSRVHMELF